MARRWTKKEVIELLDTMSLEELEILWREIEKVLGSDRRGTAADRSAWNFSDAINSKVTIPASDIVSELVAKGEL
jgi:ABC-type molybdate transport system substrate-binding protein